MLLPDGLSPPSLDDMMLISIVKWIFSSADGQWLSVTLPKFGIIFSGYCSINVFALSIYFNIQCIYY